MEPLLFLREPKKDFLAGEVKEFMCFAMFPPALPVRFTVGVAIGVCVGVEGGGINQPRTAIISVMGLVCIYQTYHHSFATYPRP